MIQIAINSIQYPYHPCVAVDANSLAVLDACCADAGPNDRRNSVFTSDYSAVAQHAPDVSYDGGGDVE